MHERHDLTLDHEPKARSVQSRLRRILTSSVSTAVLLWLMTPGFAQQLPTGGTVSAGSASFARPNASTLNINQSSNQAIINWQSFSAGAGSTVNFNQPGASSATLNRVLGSTPSSIAGTINAPGTVLLVNPNGIAITRSGVINTGSFAASTLDIKDSDFLAGRYKFSGTGASAAVSNSGRINVSDGGFAALLGGQVANDGVISARLGKVGLGAGEAATLDLSGDGFLAVTVPSSELGKLVKPDRALVSNKGRINADGGTVYLSAATAANVLRNAVNIPGSVRTNTVGSHNGRIVINGGAGGTVKVSGRLTANGRHGKAGSVAINGARVHVSGTISATGAKAGAVVATAADQLTVSGKIETTASTGKGGTIDLTAANVRLLGALIDASGSVGGGVVEIGGGLHGGGSLAHAQNVSIDSASTVRADALNSGNGGTIAVWSDGNTVASGTFSARGGANDGNGGVIETSGHSVDFTGIRVNASAANGAAGVWLVDPTDLTIDSAAAATIANTLDSGTSVTLQTNFDGTTHGPGITSSGAGDIVFNANLYSFSSTGTTLTVQAYNNIVLNAGFSTYGSFVAQAGGSFTSNANVGIRGTTTIAAKGDVTIGGSSAFVVGNDLTITTIGNFVANGYIGTLSGAPSFTTTVTAVGNIQANNNLSTNGTTTYNAGGNINLTYGCACANGDITLRADYFGTGSGTVAFSNGAKVGGSQISILYNPSSYSSPTNYSGNVNSGSLTAYMLVNSAANLNAINSNLGGTYALGKDVSAGSNFIPIGYDSNGANLRAFTGLFDGQGHMVTDLSFKYQFFQQAHVGLFGMNNGTIRNVGVSGTIVDNFNVNIGALAGVNNGTISNAFSAASVTGSSSNNDNVGGLVGYNAGTITGGSYATGTVSSNANAGGLVGFNAGGGVVQNSYAAATVNGDVAGGLVGFNDLGALINNTYALGSVHGNTYTGGLVGQNNQSIAAYATIQNSYAAGHLSGNSIGGLVGYNAYPQSENQSDFNSQIGQSAKVWWSAWNFDTTGTRKAFGTSYLDRSGYSSENVQYIGFTTVNSLAASVGQGGNLGSPYSLSSYSIFNDPTPGNGNMQSTGFAANWYMIDGSTMPFLNAEYSTTITNAHQLQLINMNGSANYKLTRDITFVNDGMWSNAGFSPIAPQTALNVETKVYGYWSLNSGLASQSQTQSGNNLIQTFVYSGPTYPVQQTLVSDTYATSYQLTNFSGTLNGNDHTINNLTENVTSGNAGLFSTVGRGGTVQNLGLINPQIYADNHLIAKGSVGSAVGDNAGTIYNVWATGGQVNSWFASDTGGLVGTNTGTVAQSYANVQVWGVNQPGAPDWNLFFDHDGGLIGANYGQIANTYALGAVHGNGSVGGLVGYNGGAIANSYTTGLIANNYNYGINSAGALVGNNPGSVSNSFWDSSVATNQSGPGTGLSTTRMQDLGSYASTYTNWDFFNIWAPPNQASQGGQSAASYPVLYASNNIVVLAANGASQQYGTAAPPLTGGLYSLGDIGRLGSYSIGQLTGSTTPNSPVGAYSIGLQQQILATDVGTRTCNSSCQFWVTINGLALGGNVPSIGDAVGLVNLYTGITGVTATVDANGHLVLQSPRSFNVSATYPGPDDSFGIIGTGFYPYTPAATATASMLDGRSARVLFLPGTLTVTPAPLTVTATSVQKAYGQTVANGSTGYSVSGLVNGDTVTSVSFGSTGLAANAAVDGGPYAITPSNAQGSGLGNYTIAYVNGTLTINPATLTYTANSAAMTYGSTVPGLSGTVTGFVNGETLNSATTGTLAFTTTATSTSNVGHYAINGSGLTANHGNYVFASAAANASAFSVTPAPITVTANGGSSVYGSSPSDPGLSATGLQNGQDVSVLSGLSNSFGIGPTTNVASGPYTLSVLGTLTNANYSISARNTGTWTITPAPITVTANGGSSVYGSSPSDPGLSATGLQNGQDVSVLSGLSNSFGIGPTTNVAGAPYALSVLGALTNANYSISARNTGTWTITPAPITVTANGGTSVYGSSPSDPGLSATGLQNGQDVSVLTGLSNSFSIGPTTNVAGGPYTLSVLGTLTNANYAISARNTGTWTVTPAPITVTANGGSSVYGSSPSDPGLSATGLQNGQDVSVLSGLSNSFGIGPTTNVAGAPYALSVLGALTNANYSISARNTGTWTITPAPITVTANGGTSVYGSSPSDPGLSATGLQNGQDVSVLTGLSNSFGIGPTTNVAGGPYTLSVLGALTNANYAISARNTGTWTVTPAPITVTANGGSSVYGSSPSDPGLSATGLQNGQDVSVLSGLSNSFGIGPTTNVAGGPYTLSVLGALTNANYSISARNTGTWTVTPAPITVTANGGTSVYGSSPSDPGLSATGLQNGQDVSVLTGLSNSFGIGPTTNVAGGPYTLSVLGALTNANYSISARNTGTWTITPAPITVTANGGTSVYGSSPSDPGLSATGLQNGQDVSVLSGLSNSFGIGPTTNVTSAPYALSVLGALTNANYSISARNTGTWTVTPAPITVTANGGTSVYGSSPTDPGLSATGLQNGQDVGVLIGLSNSFGIGPTTNVAGGPYTLSVLGALTNANYSISARNTGTWTVTPAPLTITANSRSKTYGDTLTLIGREFSSIGLQNGESIGAVALTSKGQAATATVAGGPYPIAASGATGGTFNIANYSVTYINGSLTVIPADIIVSALGGTSIYGTSPNDPGLSAAGLRNGENVSVLSGLSNSFGIDQFSNAGNHILTVLGTLTNPNYIISGRVPGTWIVDRAQLAYVANSAMRYYGDSNPPFSGTVTGFVNGETLATGTTGTLNFTSPATKDSVFGTFAINGSGLNAANYRFVQAPANATALTITMPPTIAASQFSPPVNDPPPATVNVNFETRDGGSAQAPISFTPRVKQNADGDGTTGSLPEHADIARNNGRIFPPISEFDANQYEQLKIPDYAAQASQATVFTMIARAAVSKPAQDMPINRFWNGTAADLNGTTGENPVTGQVTFSDGAGHQVTPGSSNGFAIRPDKTNFAELLKSGPVMIGGASGHTPAQWLLATGLAPDGKSILCNDPVTGKVVALFLDPTTGAAGSILGFYDPKSKGILQLADNSGTLPAGANIEAIKDFVPSTFFAVRIQ